MVDLSGVVFEFSRGPEWTTNLLLGLQCDPGREEKDLGTSGTPDVSVGESITAEKTLVRAVGGRVTQEDRRTKQRLRRRGVGVEGPVTPLQRTR